MPTPTSEQQYAIETIDRALVIEAGAGTGKTWVLVTRFLHLLDQHPDWPIESVIAITFTEKAAREMRNRIRTGVEERAAAAAPDSHWHTRRRRIDQLQVGTVHSLCARLLRENAIAAHLDPRFDVLDEEEAGLLAREAVRRTLQVLNATPDHPALALFAGLSVMDVNSAMLDLLGKRGTVQRLFDDLADEEALLTRWAEALAGMRQQAWRRLCRQDPLLVQALNELPLLDHAPAGDKLTPTVETAQAGCRCLENDDWRGAWEAWNSIRLTAGSGKAWGKERLAEVKAMLRALRDAIRAMDKQGVLADVGELDAAAAADLHAWRALWTTLTAIYAELKAARHVLDFDDLELETAALVRRSPMSRRLETYLTSVRHVMVDEFQDTNPIQREIVYALAPPTAPGRLFVVGDAKQSIYRFRQAQVSIFNQVARDVQRATGDGPAPLSRSFRTHQALVAATNHLFARLLRPLDGDAHQDFEAGPGPLTAQRTMPPGTDAPVEFWILPEKLDDDTRMSAEDARRWEAHLLADHLLTLERERALVWEKEEGSHRPFRFKDAAILFRATTSLPIYEDVFKQKGLPYLTLSGRGYYDRPEVNDLLALLAVLHNPADEFNLAVVLRSPLFSLSDETLLRLRRRDPDNQHTDAPRPLAAALAAPPPTDQDAAVAHAHTVLSDLRQDAGRVDVWTLLRKALDRTAYETTLAMHARHNDDGGRPVNNVQKLLGMAREAPGASLSGFLRRVTDLRAAEVREGEALGREPQSGAVQLMSIHAAKGLEFPVVAVADLGRAPMGGGGGYILHDPAIGLVCKVRDENGDWQSPAGYNWGQWQIGQMEEAEDKRLLYVACTRAADRLILSGRRGNKGWLGQIAAAWDIDQEGETVQEVTMADGADTFRLRVRRPTDPPEELRAAPAPAESHPGLVEMTALSRPLTDPRRLRRDSVTGLLRSSMQGEDDAAMGPIPRPVVLPMATGRRFHPVPRYLLGNIVHRALADWTILSLGPQARQAHLAGIARSLGVSDAEAVTDAARRADRLLANVRRAPIYTQIQASARRLHEVPFTLMTDTGPLHGTIDLLYRGDDGWMLLDWKSEWVGRHEIAAKAEAFLPQVALYHQAARHLLQDRIRAGVCLLAAGAAVHWYDAGALATVQSSLGVMLPAQEGPAR